MSHPDDRQANEQQIQQLLSRELANYQLEKRFLHRDGSPIDVSLEVRAVGPADGALEYLVVMLEDISARKQAEKALLRQKNLYDCLSETNQTIVRVPDRTELFASICRIAVEHGGFRFAWVALLDDSRQLLQPVSQYGEDGGYVQQARISLSVDTPRGRGLSARALRTGQHSISNDFLHDPATTPWQAAAHSADIRSAGRNNFV